MARAWPTGVQEGAISEFGAAMECRYKDVSEVPYHNRYVSRLARQLAASRPCSASVCPCVCWCSVHGADVLQTVHALLSSGGLVNRLTPLETLSMVLAATAHDVGGCGCGVRLLR